MAIDVPREYNRNYTKMQGACVIIAHRSANSFYLDGIDVSNKEFDRPIHGHLPEPNRGAKQSIYVLEFLSKLIYGQRGEPRNIKRQNFDQEDHIIHFLDSSFIMYGGNVVKVIKRFMLIVSKIFHEVMLCLVLPLLILDLVQQSFRVKKCIALEKTNAIKGYLREFSVKEDVKTLIGNKRGFLTIIHGRSRKPLKIR